MNVRKDLLAGTRPEITGGRIIMSGAEGFDGYEIMEYKGMVWGISARAKDMGQDLAMGCKQVTGGELQSYTALGDESRQRALDRMLKMAARQGANAIINVEFELGGAQHGASQAVVHGTAVIIRPVENYIPVGAAGNILMEIKETLGQGRCFPRERRCTRDGSGGSTPGPFNWRTSHCAPAFTRTYFAWGPCACAGVARPCTAASEP
jgi:uncharacterized protein YbjQ (UPF0145 family)